MALGFVKGLVGALLLGTLVACGSGPSASGSTGTSQAALVPGYQHALANSRFRLGSVVDADHQFGALTQVVGTYGVFATNTVTGAASGLENAGAPGAAAYSGTGEQHSAAVRAYFVSGGLPSDQIARVALNVGGGSSSSGSEFYSCLIRAVDGVPVVESEACASFDGAGTTTWEQVYWPTLPECVVTEAQALQAMMHSSEAYATFLSKLPSNVAGGDVAIHHTGDASTGPFVAFASYDVQQDGTTLHFDVNGQELWLPDEDAP